MAPPRHRRKRRPSRTISSTPPVVQPEPEPLPPPRRGLMAALFAPPPPPPPGSARAMRPMMRVPAPSAPNVIWSRRDFLVLSGIAGAVVVVIGLLISVSGATISSTVKASPAPTTTTFSVASGAGKTFLCGPSVNFTVGGVAAQVASIDGDAITLAAPLNAPPAPGASVDQSSISPATVTVCGAVAASPAPTTTELTLAGGAGQIFGQGTINVGGQIRTVKAVDATSYRITLTSALPVAPSAGTEVTEQFPYAGSLIEGVSGLAISEISIIILAVAAWVSRPFAVRIVKKARPGLLETFVFGALVAVVDTLVFYLLESTLAPTTGGGAAVAQVVALVSGFILVPLAYPAITRMFFRRRQRQGMAGPSGR